MKIALGCVQFGMPYGVANSAGKVSQEEAREILSLAREEGIDTLDTASSYGESEAILGQIGTEPWKVITKLRPLPPDCTNVVSWVVKEVEASCARLNTRTVEGILIHHLPDLFSENGGRLVDGLQEARARGLSKKIGVSIYDPSKLEEVGAIFWPEIVQAPFSIFDRRLLESGWAKKLAASGSEIHVRSVFLQGLLLMNPTDRPQRFSKFAAIWDAWDSFCVAQGKSPLQLCLQYALSHPEFARVVVGVASKGQLQQVLEAESSRFEAAFDLDLEVPGELIDPRGWNDL